MKSPAIGSKDAGLVTPSEQARWAAGSSGSAKVFKADAGSLLGPLPKLEKVIEELGMGPVQIMQTFVGGGVWLADGAAILLLSSCMHAIAAELGLQPTSKGAVVSTMFVGAMLGNFASGPLSDSRGRRLPIILSYVGVSVCMCGCALPMGYGSLLLAAVLLGTAFGLGQPSWSALCQELTPSPWRMPLSTFAQSLFVFGEIYSAFLIWCDDPAMQTIHWRYLMAFGSLPAVCFAAAAIFVLRESPSWLSLQGRHEDAKGVLENIRQWNRLEHRSVDFSAAPVYQGQNGSLRQQLGIIFGKTMLYSTIVNGYSCFCLNFLYYGCLYAFPQVLTEVHMGFSPAVALMFGAVMEIPGFALATLCGMFLDRRPGVLYYLLLTASSLIVFTLAGKYQHSTPVLAYVLQSSYTGVKVFTCIGFVLVIQYVSEVYPTNARVAGLGLCFAGGRIGSVIAPLVFERLTAWSGTWTSFFYVIVTILSINAVLVLFLPYETRNRPLKDDVEDGYEAEPMVNCQDCIDRKAAYTSTA